jgi:SAM-dependent methyltransferase
MSLDVLRRVKNKLARSKSRQVYSNNHSDRYDFIDLGCSEGGSFDIGYKLAGPNGLGIDLSDAKVEKAKKLGRNVIQGDITQVDLPDHSANLVICSHVLEHLKTKEAIQKTVEQAIRLAKRNVHFRGPWFDADDYLAKHDLKCYWSDWHGHPSHVKTWELGQLLEPYKQKVTWAFIDQILDSNNDCILHISTEQDQHHFDPKIHPEKPYVEFAQTIFREWVCEVQVG